MKCSVTLLKNAVNEMGRRSSSVSGIGILPIGTMCSIFHWLGHSPVLEILLMIQLTGLPNSGANSWVSCLGRSLGTPDLGFLKYLKWREHFWGGVVGVAQSTSIFRWTACIWTEHVKMHHRHPPMNKKNRKDVMKTCGSLSPLPPLLHHSPPHHNNFAKEL